MQLEESAKQQGQVWFNPTNPFDAMGSKAEHLANKIINSALRPDWIDESKSKEEQVNELYLILLAGFDIGMKWSEAIQSLIPYNGFICIRAHSCKALVQSTGVLWEETREGSVKDGTLCISVKTTDTSNPGVSFYTELGMDYLIQSGLYDPNFKAGEVMPSISQLYPERTLLARVRAYHYRDHHKVFGIEILEEIKSWGDQSAEIKVATGEGKTVNLGTAQKEKDKVDRIVKEGLKHQDKREANPLTQKPNQVDLEDSIKEVQGSKPWRTHPIEEIPAWADEKKMTNMTLKLLLKTVKDNLGLDGVNLIESIQSCSGKNTNKKFRDGINAYLAGEIEEYVTGKGGTMAWRTPVDEAEEPEDTPNDGSEGGGIDVDEADPPTDTPNDGSGGVDEAPDPDNDTTGNSWFFSVAHRNAFIRPATMTKELLSDGYLFLGKVERGDSQEMEYLIEKWENENTPVPPQADKDEALDPDHDTTEDTSGGELPKGAYEAAEAEYGDLVTELDGRKQRGFGEFSELWTKLADTKGLLDAITTEAEALGFTQNEFFMGAARNTILNTIGSCM